MTYTTAPTAAADLDTRKQYLSIVVLGLGIFMAALDLTIVAPAFPALQQSFNVSARAIAWVIGMYALFNVLSQPTMAKLADRYGRRAVYLADVAFSARGHSSPFSRRTSASSSWRGRFRGSARAASSRRRTRSLATRFRRSGAASPTV